MTSADLNKSRSCFAATAASLALIRAYVTDLAQRAGAAKVVVDDLEMAVDEAVTNVIEHGYQGISGGEVVVEVQVSHQAMTVVIADRGKAFDPSPHPAVDLEAQRAEFRTGGVGLFLIHSLVDAVAYERVDGGNQIRLTKRLSPNP